MSYIPEPITRTDKYLAYIAGNMDVAIPDYPITRKEHYLAAWAEKSGFEDMDVTGEPPLTLENAIGKPLKGLRIYGKSKQVTTTGAQLLDYDNLMPDIAYGMNGELQSNKGYVSSQLIKVTSNSPYTISGLGKVAVIILQYSSEKVLLSRKTSNTNGTYTTLEDVCYIGLTFYAGVTVDMLKNVMLNAGSTPLPWELYTGGKPSPSPEYPQEIKSAGQDGEIGVEVLSVNLFDKSAAHSFTQSGGWSASFDGEEIKVMGNNTTIGSIALFRYNKTLPAGTYTFSISKPLPFRIRINNYIAIKKGDTSATATFNNDISITHFAGDVEPGTSFNELRFKIMLNIGSIALPYEPYHESQSMDISTPNGLPGIPVSSSGNYIDVAGQQWICDEIDLAREVYVQNIKVSKSLNKLEWYTWGVNKGADGITGFFTYNIDTPKTPEAVSNIALYNDDIYGGKRAGICASIIKPTSSIPYMIVSVRNDTISDISSDNAAIQSFKDMLAKTDAYMMYVLATQIETPLTSDQLAAYKQLHTYKGTTIIDNDAGAYMSVKYEKMK